MKERRPTSIAATRRRQRYEYLLGHAPGEAARLKAQARLWDPVSHALFDRLGVGRGWRVLEVGPGQGSLHMELRRRVGGPVDAVEPSPIFARRLTALTRRDGLGAPRLWQMNLIDAPLPPNSYDLIFARWVFLFLPDPAAHVRKLARALKPGGQLALQDYHRETFVLVPRPPEWECFMAADRAFFATQGGNANIGALLPDLYRAAGLELTSVEPTVKSGHPGSPVWNWLTTYFMGVMERYATLPPFDRAQAKRLRASWQRAAAHSGALLMGPALLDVVGRKPKR